MDFIEEYLYLGSLQAYESLLGSRQRKANGITHILTVGIFPQLKFKPVTGVRNEDRRVIEVDDFETCSMMPFLDIAADYIKQCVDTKKTLLVHCQAG